ncbi:dephospho-CoA kinase [Winogradskyella sp. KYW1333]|uniref:dephospho-CoA kinase n=1 Tax=Winogradskyella sp. KYW1333 TaxID=2282123 RepID=UPI000DF2BB1B|nr:dephospho-CoA kinase [Winogradskyella sp. KYW1333]RCT54437.1 dephospho-CoA kinase [Winogradskyella sp. KYW1333]
MVVVGITGGIGSGKTTISNYLKSFGIPLYVADKEAKALMNRSKVIKRKLIQLFGDEAYVDGKLNRPFLAKMIFKDKSLLNQMNAIVHPKVASHFKRWLKKQDAPYILKEAAIIFENNLQSNYDYIITVVADENLRIERILDREDTTREKVKAVINNQWTDSHKKKLSDFVISNNDLDQAKKQALQIHKKLLKISAE